MPIFEFNNKKYNVLDKDIDALISKHPDAVTIATDKNGKQWKVKASNYYSFVSANYPDQQTEPTTAAATQSDQADSNNNQTGEVNKQRLFTYDNLHELGKSLAGGKDYGNIRESYNKPTSVAETMGYTDKTVNQPSGPKRIATPTAGAKGTSRLANILNATKGDRAYKPISIDLQYDNQEDGKAKFFPKYQLDDKGQKVYTDNITGETYTESDPRIKSYVSANSGVLSKRRNDERIETSMLQEADNYISEIKNRDGKSIYDARFEQAKKDAQNYAMSEYSKIENNANFSTDKPEEIGFRLFTASKASHLKAYDLQKMADDTWDAIPIGERTNMAEGIVSKLKSEYPNIDDKWAYQYADQTLRMANAKKIYNMAKKMNAPKNELDLFFRSFVNSNVIGSLAQGAARSQAGTIGDMAAREEAEQEYINKGHKTANIIGTVAGFATDPSMMIGGGLGKLTVGGGMALAGKAIGGAATRKAATTLTGRLTQRAVAGGVNFATFEGIGEAANQYKWGGYRDPNTGNIGDYNASAVLGSVGHGFIMGGVTGVAGELIGNVFSKAVKSTKSTVGKVGVRTAELGTAALAEGSIFAVPQIYETKKQYDEYISSLSDSKSKNYIADEAERKEVIAELERERNGSMMDVWTDNMTMIAGFKAQGLAMSARKRIAQLRRQPNSRVGFETRLRRVLDGQNSMALTKGEKAELKAAGYNDLNELVDEYKELPNDKKFGVEETNRFAQFVEDTSVSERARAKIYYYVTGHTLPLHTILSYSVEKKESDDGKTSYTIKTFGNGNTISVDTYRTKSAAEAAEVEVKRQIEFNTVDFLEKIYDAKYGEESDDKTPSEKLREEINSTTNVNIDATIKKEDNRRTEAERKALNDYIVKLGEIDVADDRSLDNSQPADPKQHTDGNYHIAKLKSKDNKEETEVYITYGDVVVREDGTIDADKSDESITIYNPQTGKKEVISPTKGVYVFEVGETLTSEEYKARNAETENAKQSTETVVDEQETTPNIIIGNEYTITDENGNEKRVIVTSQGRRYANGEYVAEENGDLIEYSDGVESKLITPSEFVDRIVKNSQEKEAPTEEAIEPTKEVIEQTEETEPTTIEEVAETHKPTETDAMPMIGNGDDAEPNYMATTPKRTLRYLYEEADIPEKVADNIVSTNLKQADTNVKNITKKIDGLNEKSITSPTKYKKERAKLEKQLEEAQNAVGYWKEVAKERRYVVEQRIANDHDWGQYEGKEYVYKGWNVRFDRVERDENGNVVVVRVNATNDKGESVSDRFYPYTFIELMEKGDFKKPELTEEQKKAQQEEMKQSIDKANNEVNAEIEKQRRIAEEQKKQREENANKVGKNIRDKWNNAAKIDGRSDEIVLPNGESVNGRFILHESGDVTASHNSTTWDKSKGFPEDENGNTVNDRDYNADDDARKETERIAEKFDQRALQSPVIVSRDGVVLSGNGRTIAGEIAARNGTDADYLDYLARFADKFGFTEEQVRSMKNPRVSFLIDKDMPYNAETFAKFNQQEMKSQSKTEQSVKLGKTVKDETFRRVVDRMRGFDTLAEFYNNPEAALGAIMDLHKDGVISRVQLAEMVDGVEGNEKLSDIGRNMLETMLVGKVFDNNPEVVRILAEMPQMRKKIVGAMSEIADNIALGDKWSLQSQLAEAVEFVYKTVKGSKIKEGESVSIYAGQLKLFTKDGELPTMGDIHNKAMLLLADAINDSRVTLLRKVFALYNSDARDSAAGQIDLFDGRVRTVEDILNDVINYINNGKKKEIEQREADAVAKRKGAGSETSLPVEEGDGKSGRGRDVNIDSGEFTPTQGEVRQQKGSGIGNVSSREAALRDVIVDRLKKSGVDVITDVEEAQRLLDEANGERLSQDKKRALETVSSSRDERYQQTVVSSADGAKVLNNLDKLVSDYEENEKTREKTFVGTVANALGAKSHNSKSEYATFETKNGRVVTIRLADHNATVSNFDNRGELDGISIVVSPKKSAGVTNDGDAHVVEYYYDAIKLRKADGKPLADIVRSIKQALFSGEFEDTTGLAERQEVNGDEVRFFRTPDGHAYGFVKDGKIFIDPRIATAETPIHEYAHLWAEAMRHNNPKEWENIVRLMRGTGIWDEVVKRYPELKSDSEIADEVLSHYSGRRGAERLREEMRKVSEGNGSVSEKAAALSALERVREALKRFWKGVADWFGIHFSTAEEVADKVLSDLLNGVNPNDFIGKRKASDKARMQEDAEMADIVARAKADGTYMKAPNGKQSKLSPRQWAQVRTKAFKDWFGDWENDPNGASKVVDENGEPRVVYHQTNSTIFVNKETGKNFDDLNWKEQDYWRNEASEEEWNDTWEERDFYAFDNKNHGRRSVEMPAFFFSPVYDEYHEYGDRTVEAFLNIRNPIVNPDIPNRGVTDTAGEDAMNALIAQGYDGFIRKYDGVVEEVNAFFPNQIKSATENIGTFDQNNPDIRYQFVGERGAAAMDKAEEASVRLDNLAVAREMETAGKDAKAVKLATGWERGGDGKWRYEIMDGRLNDGWEKKASRIQGVVLSDVLDNEELFNAYPALKNVFVSIESLTNGTYGEYRPSSNMIALSDKIVIGMDAVLAHEIQHAIQEIEGFARGGSVRDVRKRIMKRISELEGVSEHAKEMLARQVEYNALASKLGYVYERLMKNGEDWAVRAASDNYWEAMNTLDNDDNSTLENSYPKGKNAFEIAKEGFNREKAIEELKRLSDYYSSQISAEDMKNIKASEVLSGKMDGKSDEELYLSLGGEVESRNVQKRMKMSAEERRRSLASETEDVAREDQIFLEDGLGVSSSERVDASENVSDKSLEEVNRKRTRIDKLRNSESVVIKFGNEFELNRKSAKEWAKKNVRGTYTNIDTNERIEVSNVGINEATSHGTKDEAHLKSLVAIPQMIEKSIFIDELPNKKGNGKYDSYRYYVCGLKIDGVDYTAKIVVGVKGDSKYYDHRLTEMEKGTLIDNLNGLSNSVVENQNAFKSVGKDSKLVSIMQPNMVENFKNPEVLGENVGESDKAEGKDEPLYRTSAEIDAEYPNWLDDTTTEGGKHSTQITSTVGTYRKVGEWIKKNLGMGVRVLDASSGMGIGTKALREDGMQIDDVEPYQSEERKRNNPATYSSYGDIEGKYDFIISNAVLNVIPDDWRADVLHDMANRLNNGGKLFINTRKAGEEKAIKDKIELDSPQEVLVKRNGKIASYQRFFTPKELKEYVENELGSDYSVEIANEKNSGTKGLAAVVVTKRFDGKSNKAEDKRKAVDSLGERYGVKIRVVEKGNEITDADENVQKKKRGSKGWYEKGTGEVVVVLNNNESVEDVVATVSHEIIAHKGLREMIGEERYNDFLDEVYNHLREDLKKEVDTNAGRRFVSDTLNNKEKSKTYEQHRRDAVDELFGRFSEKPFEEFSEGERTFWQQLKKAIRKIIDKFLGDIKLPKWFELGDNEIRYILWRSKERLERGVNSKERDEAKRKELGLNGESDVLFRDVNTDMETEDIWKDKTLGLRERMTAAAVRLSENHKDSKEAKTNAMRAIGGNLSDLRKAMSAQKEYDKTTVKRVVDLAKVLIKSKHLNSLSDKEVRKLLSVVSGSVGKQDIKNSVDAIMDIMVDNQLKNAENTLYKLLHTKAKKINDKGVVAMSQLDLKGQAFLSTLKEYMAEDEKHINEAISNAADDLTSDNETIRHNAEIKYDALQLALQYKNFIAERIREGKDLKEELIRAKEETPKEDKLTQSFKEYKQSIEDAIKENKVARITAYADFVTKLSSALSESKDNARAIRRENRERVSEIHKMVIKDLGDKKHDIHTKEPTTTMRFIHGFANAVTAPFNTFEQFFLIFGGKYTDGKGYLYDYFVRGVIDARNNELLGLKEKHKQLDDKAKELFGGKNWQSLLDKYSCKAKVSIDVVDGNKIRTLRLTQGNVLYIYMVNKMSDGKMKLREMGISEEDVARLAREIDPRLIDLGDWLQEEFLPNSRDKYNATHERLFGAPMTAIENYFPIKINKNAIATKEEDLDNPERNNGIATTTGAIKERTKNSLPFDILNSDALDVVLGHIKEMEHFSAFGEINRDINTLRTYKRFENIVKNMHTFLGTGDNLLNNFNRVCQIAVGSYRPRGDNEVGKAMVNIAKGVTGAKISFRVYTALKQFASYPAYIFSASPEELAKATFYARESFVWCMDNLPIIEERWKSKVAGDPRLAKTDTDWSLWNTKLARIASKYGMGANAFVDVVTVTMGAKAIYETNYKNYVKKGYGRAEAERRAKQDATIFVNSTQQSSEGVFLSPLQVDRTWNAVMFSVFRNASFGYGRNGLAAARNLNNYMTHNRSTIINSTAKLYMSQGIEEEQAYENARGDYRKVISKNIANFLLFNCILTGTWVAMGYAPYLMNGNNEEDKKKTWKEIGSHTALGFLEGVTGGDVLGSAMAMVWTGEFNAKYLEKNMPITSDIATILNQFANGKNIEAMSNITNLLVSSATGVDPRTFGNMVNAFVEACGNDPKLANETAIFVGQLLNIPKSQLSKMYFDELNLSGNEISNYTPQQLAERYAKHKVREGYTLVPWEWDNEELLSKYEKYTKKEITESLNSSGDKEINEQYSELDEKRKAYNSEKMKIYEMAEEDIDKANEMYANLMQKYKDDIVTIDILSASNKEINKIVKGYFKANTPSAAILCKETLVETKKQVINLINAKTAEERKRLSEELTQLIKDFYAKYEEYNK